MKKHKIKCPTRGLELMTIEFAFENWEALLYEYEYEIYEDHTSLRYIGRKS